MAEELDYDALEEILQRHDYDKTNIISILQETQGIYRYLPDTQINHIQERHPDDYERFLKHGKDMVLNPDYIIEANKPFSGVLLKETVEKGEKLYLVLRLKTSVDPKDHKNSVITFTKIKPKEWRRMLRNKKILYKRVDK